jgi:hypothetical protein
MSPSLTPELGRLLPLLPLGLLAGVLSGLLGIGGGLIFAPLLLFTGLEPHEALATSTLAIVPTTVGGTWAHLRQGRIRRDDGVAIALGAALAAGLFSRLGRLMQGSWLLALQALMYALLAASISPRSGAPCHDRRAEVPRSGLVAVGGVAVLASSSTAAAAFLTEGRANAAIGLLLGGTAAVAARWSAARLQRASETGLARLLQALTLGLAVAVGLRAFLPARGDAPSGVHQERPEGGIEFEAQHRRHLGEAVAAVETGPPRPGIEQEQPVGDPQLQGFRSEADPLGAAEAMGQQHRHMAAEGAAAALEQQRQPGMQGISPQAPQAHLGDLRELTGILRRPRPLQLQFHAPGEVEQPFGGKGRQRGQRGQIETADPLRRHLQGGEFGEGWGGHQEL